MHIRTYINPVFRFSCAAQKAGASGKVLYCQTRNGKERDEFINDLRKGDGAEVMWLHLFARPRHPTKNPTPLRELEKVMAALAAKGAVILEWGSGTIRRSDNPNDLKAMLFDAMGWLTKGRRGHNAAQAGALGGAKGGRPRNIIATDPAKRALAEKHWTSTKHKTNEDAIRAMKAAGLKTANLALMYDLFGGSGREARKPRKKR